MVSKRQYSGSTSKKQAGGLLEVLQRKPEIIEERKPPMLRTMLMTAVLLCASQAAFAQELTAEQRSACMGDYEKFCKGVAPGGGRIIACLAKESDKITPACKKVLTAAEKK
jgi:hypothetical protein